MMRRLSPSDVSEYRRVRLLGLKESPTSFGSSYGDEAKRPVSMFRDRLCHTAANWTFGAFDGPRLLGVVTLRREEGRKEKHKAGIYGMYVIPEARKQGVGRGLLEQALAKALQLSGLRQSNLSVTEDNHAALSLYKHAGFEVYGREVDALLIGGNFHAELLLVRKVSPEGRIG